MLWVTNFWPQGLFSQRRETMEIQIIEIKWQGMWAVLKNDQGLYLQDNNSWGELGEGMVKFRIYQSPIYNNPKFIRLHFQDVSALVMSTVPVVNHPEIVYVPPS